MAAEEPINQGAPGAAPSQSPPGGESPLSAAGAAGVVDEHPELLVGAAFVGGFAVAQILKQFRR